ncbi:MAG: hypothetical protein AB7J35_14100 [Dehalococcoidia bacterium]
MPEQRGRPVIGAIAGFFFGLFLAIDLLLMNAIPLDSAMIVVLPLAFLVVGIVAGLFAPLRLSRR